jgi:hypothetical protein
MADPFIPVPGVTVEDRPLVVNQDTNQFGVDDDKPMVVAGFNPQPVSDSVATHRANKYDYALGPDSPGFDQLRHEVLSGEEERQRDYQTKVQAIKDQQVRTSILQQYIRDNPNQLNQQDVEAIMSAPMSDIQHPETFYEKRYARRMLQDVSVMDADEDDENNSTLSLADNESPAQTDQILSAAERIKANQELDLKRLENAEARAQQMGWGSAIMNTAEMITPFLSWARLSNAVKGANASSVLLGNNLEEQIAYLNSLPTDERKAKADEAFEELYAKNPYDAMLFAKSLASYNSVDQFLNNAVSVTDLTLPLPGVGIIKGATYAKAGQAVLDLADVAKAAIKASGQRATNPTAVLANTGNIPQAAFRGVVNDLATNANQVSNSVATAEFLGKGQFLTNPNAALGNDFGHLSAEYRNRLASMLENNGAAVMRAAFTETATTPRLDQEGVAQLAGIDATRDLLNVHYGQGMDVIIDIKPIAPDTTLGNVNYAKVTVGKNKDLIQTVVGTPQATLFDTKKQAIAANRDFYRLADATPIKIGKKWGLQFVTPVNETLPSVREALVKEVQAAPTRKTVANTLMPYLRSGDDITSARLTSERKTAIMGASELSKLAEQISAPIGNLSKNSKDALNRVMNWETAVKTKGAPTGSYANTISELEQNWMSIHNRLPSEKEVDAYFAARQIQDLQWVVTNTGLHRDLSRKGVEQFSWLKSNAERPSVQGIRKTPDDIFRFQENAGIAIVDDVDPQKVVTYQKNFMTRASGMTQADLKKLLKDGTYKVVQLTGEGSKKFKELHPDIAGKNINFVIAKDVASAPLDYNIIPHRPGWHLEYADGYFIRQAKIRASKEGGSNVHFYDGDNNFFHYVTKEEGASFNKRLEHARQLYQKGDKVGLKLYIQNGGLPMSYSNFVRMFKGKNKLADVNEPFYLTRKDEAVEDVTKLADRYQNLNSSRNSPYNVYRGGINLDRAIERNDVLKSAINTGDELAPVWNFKRAKLMDSLGVLDRNTSHMLRGVYIEDFKHKAAEQYIAEFKNVIKGTENEEVWREMQENPFKVLLEGQLNDTIIDNRDLLNVAKATRRNTLEFLHVKDPFARNVDSVKAKLWDKTLNKGVNDAALKGTPTTKEQVARDWANMQDGWLMSTIKDPARAMRAFAFHTKLGLFNPIQFFLQAQTMAHVIGVAGVQDGSTAAVNSWLQRATMLLPQHSDRIAKMAFGMKPDDFKEMHYWGKRTGWFRVGHEVAVRDDMITTRAIQSKYGKFLEWGTKPFAEGERYVRMAAWNAAYNGWKRENPAKLMTSVDAQKVLSRADLYSGNMTAASNASWQRGFAGVPTQFFAYQTRLMEQFIGKRLEPKEKFRAFMTYGAFYGFPVAAGAATGLLPTAEIIKQYFLEKGWDTDANVGTRLLTDGAISTIAAYATGEEYNFGERYGPGGLPFLRDILSGDSTTLETLGGVSGTSIADFIRTSEPFTYALLNTIGYDSPYKMTTEDMWDIARNVNSVNTLYNTYHALAFGDYVSRNGRVTIDDLGGMDALFTFFGMHRGSVDETYRMLRNEKSVAAWKKKGVQEATKELKRGFDQNLSTEEQTRHIERARYLMDAYQLDLKQQSNAVKGALSGKETTVETIGKDWAMSSAQNLEYYNKKYGPK